MTSFDSRDTLPRRCLLHLSLCLNQVTPISLPTFLLKASHVLLNSTSFYGGGGYVYLSFS